jgi:hypothetical protein
MYSNNILSSSMDHYMHKILKEFSVTFSHNVNKTEKELVDLTMICDVYA